MTIIGTGSVSGPLIGGLLVSGLGWRSVFFASVAFGVVTLIAGQVVLRGGRPAQARGSTPARFDWVGAVLSSAALIIFLLGMTNAHRLGWASPAIVAAFRGRTGAAGGVRAVGSAAPRTRCWTSASFG